MLRPNAFSVGEASTVWSPRPDVEIPAVEDHSICLGGLNMRFEIQNNQLSRFLRMNYALTIGLLGFMSLSLPISIMLAENARVNVIWTVVAIFATVLILGYALMAWMVRAFTQSLSYEAKNGILSVSYTHLTLPTILLV